MPVKVLTDHKGLKYFMMTKKLTPKPAKQAEFLSKFNFIVTYQTRKKNDKADALTKKLNKCPVNNKDDKQKHKMQTLLLPERVELQLIWVKNQLQKSHKINQQEGHKPERQKSVKAE